MKKAIAIIVFGLLLGGCADHYQKFQKKAKEKSSNYRYFVQVKSPTKGDIFQGASVVSYADAFDAAKDGCTINGIYDCIPYKRGNTYVYNPPSREDKMIAKAQNVCRKIGLTPGTDKFIDCTVKMMSNTGGQQTVIVGQRRRSIYPLHCRQMGGMSNC